MSVNSTNPGAFFGGTWQRISNGRVLVGVDENDTNFNTVQKTGGSKYLQKHSHDGATGTGNTPFLRCVGAAGTGYANNHITGYTSSGYEDIHDSNNFPGSNHYHYFTTNETGTGESGNLQPYFTCYIWCRTA